MLNHRSHIVTLCLLVLMIPLSANAADDSPAKLIVLRPAAIAATKAKIAANDPSIAAAMKSLIAEAEEYLSLDPPSVTQKKIAPPSGDLHDYTSMGTYWWPDPNRADGLPYIRRDGQRNPETQGPNYDNGRQHQMSEAVQCLSLAYALSGDERFAAKATRLLRVWYLDPKTRMNPNLNFAQAIPGRCEGRGIGIIDTSRLVSLVDAPALLQGSDAWTDDDTGGLRQWMSDYLDWLRTSPNGIAESKTRNNHKTWYNAQVMALAIFTDQLEIAKAAAEEVRDLIDRQIEPDGRQPHELARTRSFSYSIFNLRAFMTLARLAEAVDIDLWHYRSERGSSIRKAIDFLAPYASADRTWTHRQITKLNRSGLLPSLKFATTVYGQEAYAKPLSELKKIEAIDENRAWLVYPEDSNESK